MPPAAFGGSHRWRWSSLILFLLVGGCGDAAIDPSLRAVLPDRAAPNTPVDIVGERLEGTVLAVSFGGKSAEIVLREPRRVRARVPTSPPGLQLLVVTVDGRVSNALAFTVEGRLDAGP